jgi:hypothetical protein
MPDFLVKNEALSEELRNRMLAWRHASFSAQPRCGKELASLWCLE